MNVYDELINQERNSMKREALTIALEQAKLNLFSMESLFESSLHFTQNNKALIGLIACEVNYDATLINVEKKKKKKNISFPSNKPQIFMNEPGNSKKTGLQLRIIDNQDGDNSFQVQPFFPQTRNNVFKPNNYYYQQHSNNFYDNYQTNQYNYISNANSQTEFQSNNKEARQPLKEINYRKSRHIYN